MEIKAPLGTALTLLQSQQERKPRGVKSLCAFEWPVGSSFSRASTGTELRPSSEAPGAEDQLAGRAVLSSRLSDGETPFPALKHEPAEALL